MQEICNTLHGAWPRNDAAATSRNPAASCRYLGHGFAVLGITWFCLTKEENDDNRHQPNRRPRRPGIAFPG